MPTDVHFLCGDSPPAAGQCRLETWPAADADWGGAKGMIESTPVGDEAVRVEFTSQQLRPPEHSYSANGVAVFLQGADIVTYWTQVGPASRPFSGIGIAVPPQLFEMARGTFVPVEKAAREAVGMSRQRAVPPALTDSEVTALLDRGQLVGFFDAQAVVGALGTLVTVDYYQFNIVPPEQVRDLRSQNSVSESLAQAYATGVVRVRMTPHLLLSFLEAADRALQG